MPVPKKETQVLPKTAKERVYNEMREWIINGTLQPDEKISDQEICRYFGVSRTPVREAIQLLADQRLINIYPGRETRVAPVDYDTIHSIYRIAAELHGLAVSMAWPKITEKEISQLKEYNQAFTHSVQNQNNTQAAHYDQLFHAVFITLADNCFLSEFLRTLEAHIQRIQRMNNPTYNLIGKKGASSIEHECIIDAIEKKDMAKAVECMRQNWLHTIEQARTAEK